MGAIFLGSAEVSDNNRGKEKNRKNNIFRFRGKGLSGVAFYGPNRIRSKTCCFRVPCELTSLQREELEFRRGVGATSSEWGAF